MTTFNGGSLGSCIDEERSKLRYVVRIAELSESSNLWTQMALSINSEACLFESRKNISLNIIIIMMILKEMRENRNIIVDIESL